MRKNHGEVLVTKGSEEKVKGSESPSEEMTVKMSRSCKLREDEREEI